jgi:four helix bundle protein
MFGKKVLRLQLKYMDSVSQMRHAAVSVPSNIAEGAARNSDKEFALFLNIAAGLLSELDTHIEIAFNLNYIALE